MSLQWFKQRVTHGSTILQVRNLRERLEEEHQALLTREQDKAALELRIGRLTKLILHSTRIGTSTAAARKQRMSLLRSFSEHMCPTVSTCPFSSTGGNHHVCIVRCLCQKLLSTTFGLTSAPIGSPLYAASIANQCAVC